MEIVLTTSTNPLDSLVKFADRLSKPGSGEIRKIADAINQGAAESFSREGNAEGRWKPLAPLTVKLRQAKGYGGAHPILVQSGGLKATWTQRGAAGHVERFQTTVSGWTLEAGASGELAEWHEGGTRRMVARPVLPFSEAAEERISSVLDYVIQQMEAATVGR